MVVSFPVLVLLKRKYRTLITKLSVELGRIEITFQPYLFQLAQLLDYPFREFRGVSAEVNQRQQFLHVMEQREWFDVCTQVGRKVAHVTFVLVK